MSAEDLSVLGIKRAADQLQVEQESRLVIPRTLSSVSSNGDDQSSDASTSVLEFLKTINVEKKSQRESAASLAIKTLGDDATQLLVKALANNSEELQVKISGVLRALVCVDECSQRFVDADGISALVNVIRHECSQAKEFAAFALGNVATKLRFAREMIEKGVLTHIFQLLKDNSVNVQHAAWFALRILASDAEAAECIVTETSGPLIDQLKSTNEEDQRTAAETLKVLSRCHMAKLVDAGIIPAALQVLKVSSCERVRQLLLFILRHLALDDAYEHQIAEQGGVPILVHLLKIGSEGEKRESAGALAYLAAHHEAMVVNGGAVPRLVTLLSSANDMCNRVAATALSVLAAKNGNATIIAVEGAIIPLVRLLSSSTPGTQEVAAEALWNLLRDSDNHADMVTAGVLPVFLQLLKVGNDPTKTIVASALVNLAREQSVCEYLVRAGILPILIAQVQQGTTASARFAALACIRNISFAPRCIASLCTKEIVVLLVETIVQKEEKLQLSAASCLRNIIKGRRNRERVEDVRRQLHCVPVASLQLLQHMELSGPAALVRDNGAVEVCGALQWWGFSKALTQLATHDDGDVRRCIQALQEVFICDKIGHANPS